MLYLASTSPRRKELLQQIGLEFECLAIDVDESVVRQESPQCYVARLSKIKRALPSLATKKNKHKL